MCKTRRVSLFTHGIYNATMNYGVIIEAGLMVVLTGVPGLNTAVMGAQFPPGTR
jgi:hypothetical protein